jgi:hypothetical protein
VKTCTFCGRETRDADRFCASCGSPFAATPPPAPAAPAVEPEPKTTSTVVIRSAKPGRIRRGPRPVAPELPDEAYEPDVPDDDSDRPRVPLAPLFGSSGSGEGVDSENALIRTASRYMADERFAGWVTTAIAVLVIFVIGVAAVVTSRNSSSHASTTTSTTAGGYATGGPGSVSAGATGSDVGIASPTSTDTLPRSDSPELRSDSERYFVNGNMAHVVGEVTNISGSTLTGLKAVTTFYDNAGDVIALDTQVLPINNLDPGQSSPYQTIVTASPLIYTETTRFVDSSGGQIGLEVQHSVKPGGNTTARRLAPYATLHPRPVVASKPAKIYHIHIAAVTPTPTPTPAQLPSPVVEAAKNHAPSDWYPGMAN